MLVTLVGPYLPRASPIQAHRCARAPCLAALDSGTVTREASCVFGLTNTRSLRLAALDLHYSQGIGCFSVHKHTEHGAPPRADPSYHERASATQRQFHAYTRPLRHGLTAAGS